MTRNTFWGILVYLAYSSLHKTCSMFFECLWICVPPTEPPLAIETLVSLSESLPETTIRADRTGS